MSPRLIAKLLAAVGAVALAAIVIITVVVVRSRTTEQKLQTIAAVVPGALLHAHNFHWTQMRGDKSQWVLKAKDASYSNDKTSIILTDAELSMTTKDGKRLLLQTPRAKLRMSGNHISRADMTGGLRVDYGDFVLSTGNATFLPDNDEIEAPGEVKIDGPGLQVAGIGMTGHPKEQTFQLLKQVTTRIDQKKKTKGASAKVS
ncbi:MAG TPA: LPS export ABC transporter periplasmic protein LptC [Candidatus Binataceae bacterium]|nr:LPS export ABC transporter periplasmic protein LptC [Candidatus Binataceae bacterium]